MGVHNLYFDDFRGGADCTHCHYRRGPGFDSQPGKIEKLFHVVTGLAVCGSVVVVPYFHNASDLIIYFRTTATCVMFSNNIEEIQNKGCLCMTAYLLDIPDGSLQQRIYAAGAFVLFRSPWNAARFRPLC